MPGCQEIEGLIEPEQIAAEFSSTIELDGTVEPEQVEVDIEVCT